MKYSIIMNQLFKNSTLTFLLIILSQTLSSEVHYHSLFWIGESDFPIVKSWNVSKEEAEASDAYITEYTDEKGRVVKLIFNYLQSDQSWGTSLVDEPYYASYTYTDSTICVTEVPLPWFYYLLPEGWAQDSCDTGCATLLTLAYTIQDGKCYIQSKALSNYNACYTEELITLLKKDSVMYDYPTNMEYINNYVQTSNEKRELGLPNHLYVPYYDYSFYKAGPYPIIFTE